MEMAVFLFVMSVPLWVGVGRVRSEAAEIRIRGETEVRRDAHRYLSELGSDLLIDGFEIRENVGDRALGSKKKSTKIASSGPENAKFYTRRQRIMVAVERLNRVGLGVELGIFSIEDVRASNGDAIGALFRDTRNVVDAIEADESGSFQSYFTLMNELESVTAQRDLRGDHE